MTYKVDIRLEYIEIKKTSDRLGFNGDEIFFSSEYYSDDNDPKRKTSDIHSYMETGDIIYYGKNGFSILRNPAEFEDEFNLDLKIIESDMGSKKIEERLKSVLSDAGLDGWEELKEGSFRENLMNLLKAVGSVKNGTNKFELPDYEYIAKNSFYLFSKILEENDNDVVAKTKFLIKDGKIRYKQTNTDQIVERVDNVINRWYYGRMEAEKVTIYFKLKIEEKTAAPKKYVDLAFKIPHLMIKKSGIMYLTRDFHDTSVPEKEIYQTQKGDFKFDIEKFDVIGDDLLDFTFLNALNGTSCNLIIHILKSNEDKRTIAKMLHRILTKFVDSENQIFDYIKTYVPAMGIVTAFVAPIARVFKGILKRLAEVSDEILHTFETTIDLVPQKVRDVDFGKVARIVAEYEIVDNNNQNPAEADIRKFSRGGGTDINLNLPKE